MKRIQKCFVFLAAVFCLLLIPKKDALAFSSVDLPLNGSWITQTISADEDVLYYRVVLPLDGRLDMTFQTFRDSTYLHFLDADLNDTNSTRYFRVQINDGSLNEPGSESQSIYLSRGTYYIKAADNVYGSGFGGAGDVRIKATFTSANTTEIEPNNTWSQAMELSAGRTVRGILTVRDDVEDFYRIRVTGTGEAVFTLTSMCQSGLLQVYTEDYMLVGECAATGAETEPKVEQFKTSLNPGTYYIKITDNIYGSTTHTSGIYELKWQISVPVTGLSLNKSSLSIYKGASSALKASIAPSDATNQTVSWSSSDTSVATVDKNGKVKGIKAGTAVITATSAENLNITQSCTVTVKSPKLTVSKTSVTLYKGKTQTVKASATPSATVTFTSSNTKVAAVSSSGKITAKAKGTCTITAKANGITKKIKVTVKNPTLTVSKTSITLYKDKTQTVKAVATPSATVTFTSSNTKVAAVSSSGKITAKAKGTCTITAKANGITKKIKVTVKNPTLKLNKTSVTLTVKKTFKIKATAAPSAKVSFKSSNTKVASVSSAGKITAKKKGTCKITVKANGITKTVKVTVK